MGTSANAGAGGRGAPVPKDVDYANYFCTYAFLYHQKEMLSDRVRMDAYFNAIFENKRHFAGKTVLDVGTGSGILAIWSAQAGARKVYAVEATKMSEHARALVKANNLQNVVEVIEGSMEDVTLPEKVDVIISEWMGYFLLRESMFDSVIHARDHWLKPTGVMYPSHARMWMAPIRTGIGDHKLAEYASTMDEWHAFVDETKTYYGVDMGSLTKPFSEEQRKYYLQASSCRLLRFFNFGLGWILGHVVRLRGSGTSSSWQTRVLWHDFHHGCSMTPFSDDESSCMSGNEKSNSLLLKDSSSKTYFCVIVVGLHAGHLDCKRGLRCCDVLGTFSAVSCMADRAVVFSGHSNLVPNGLAWVSVSGWPDADSAPVIVHSIIVLELELCICVPYAFDFCFCIYTSLWNNLHPHQVIGTAAIIKEIDCLTATVTDIEKVRANFSLSISMENTKLCGFGGWFDVHFRGRSEDPAEQEIELTTAPSVDYGTHWGQQVFLLHPPMHLSEGDDLKVSFLMSRSKENHRLMEVELGCEIHQHSGKLLAPFKNKYYIE
ncbi:unnamed protein product [Sphenostylis stenocarpa]|uniref:Protein arginine N-methyltransferase domain-containing protein n=1 Tax=Sphenostylis stenocarpa TaxID=92480 RepID=A0AA86SYW8_9FABA|nr:unnamed protein product [Sphenostylis stenocarpa]